MYTKIFCGNICPKINQDMAKKCVDLKDTILDQCAICSAKIINNQQKNHLR